MTGVELMSTAIVKYSSGNVSSVKYAFDRLGAETVLTDDPEILTTADRVVFPGVGEASTAMAYLRERELDNVIKALRQPVLAICLGMQLLGRTSEENNTACLDILPFVVHRLGGRGLKVPHMGWNTIHDLASPIFEGIADSEHMYFVHSYYVDLCAATIAKTEHGQTFSAAVRNANFYGLQFHPERSGPAGARILENFLNL